MVAWINNHDSVTLLQEPDITVASLPNVPDMLNYFNDRNGMVKRQGKDGKPKTEKTGLSNAKTCPANGKSEQVG